MHNNSWGKNEENARICKVKIEKKLHTKKSIKKNYLVFTRVFNF